MKTPDNAAGKTTELIMLLISQYIADDVQSRNSVYQAVYSSIRLHDKKLADLTSKGETHAV